MACLISWLALSKPGLDRGGDLVDGLLHRGDGLVPALLDRLVDLVDGLLHTLVGLVATGLVMSMRRLSTPFFDILADLVPALLDSLANLSISLAELRELGPAIILIGALDEAELLAFDRREELSSLRPLIWADRCRPCLRPNSRSANSIADSAMIFGRRARLLEGAPIAGAAFCRALPSSFMASAAGFPPWSAISIRIMMRPLMISPKPLIASAPASKIFCRSGRTSEPRGTCPAAPVMTSEMACPICPWRARLRHRTR